MVDEAHATGVFGQRPGGGRTLRGGRPGPDPRGDAEQGPRLRGRIRGREPGAGRVAGEPCPALHLFHGRVRRPNAAAALAALDIVEREPERRERLLARAADAAASLADQGWDTGRSESQIIPLLVGDPRRAVELAGPFASTASSSQPSARQPSPTARPACESASPTPTRRR